MDDLTQIEEYWYPIEEFPEYEISNTGLVVNSDTNRIMRMSTTAQGALKVGLMGADGRQHTRSVKVLVAEAFVGGRDDIFNTPINLDGDQENCCADNLTWRPRWFACKYSAQFGHEYRYYTASPIEDVASRELYTNIREAAIRNGLLFKDVLVSCHHGKECFPTGQVFRFVAKKRR